MRHRLAVSHALCTASLHSDTLAASILFSEGYRGRVTLQADARRSFQVLLELEKDYQPSNKPLSITGGAFLTIQLDKQNIHLCKVIQLSSK